MLESWRGGQEDVRREHGMMGDALDAMGDLERENNMHHA